MAERHVVVCLISTCGRPLRLTICGCAIAIVGSSQMRSSPCCSRYSAIAFDPGSSIWS